jgi:membrane-associated phospholipid phosphatase
MKITWDEHVSQNMYLITKDSALLRPLAMFCATILLFVMITVVAITYAGFDPMTPVVDRFVSASVILGLPILSSWFVCFILQRLVGRKRPFEAGATTPLITMTWLGPSFPSAHAAIAFATAMIGFFMFAPLYGPWIFIAAACVAVSRVATGVHYLTDVIVGALIGIVVGSLTWFSWLWLVFLSPWH